MASPLGFFFFFIEIWALTAATPCRQKHIFILGMNQCPSAGASLKKPWRRQKLRSQSELGGPDFAVAARIRLVNLYSSLKINYMPLTARVKWHSGACWPTAVNTVTRAAAVGLAGT